MNPTPCPPDAELNGYLRGLLSESDSSAIESHLSSCRSCEEKLESNGVISDSLFQSIRDVSVEPSKSTTEQRTAESIALEAAQRIVASKNPEILSSSESIGAYELIKTLGSGGMGNVYLAKHRKLKKEVAIKVLSTRHLPDQSELIRRFEREIHAAGSLDHPTIVAARDAGEVDSNLYLVMEYIDGLDLSVLIRRMETLSIADACAIGVQISLGLSHAHAKGMVHRDIKPSNIMLNENGDVKILDFGLVLLNPWDEAAGELTTIGHFLGTLDYMAPEQAERSSAVDYRADLYSLGATLFRLLTGRPPLAATPNLSPLEKLRLLTDHTPPSLKTLRPDAPTELVELIDSMLSTDPRRRPASAANIAEKLESLAQGADLYQLIAKAKSQDELPSQTVPAPRLTNYFDSNRTNRNRNSKWRWAVAAGLLPLAMLAGIAITIATDRGTLRIESDNPDVQVNIARVVGPNSKTELRVEKTETDIRLASGEYEIRIANTDANGFSLERDRVLITRGDKEIVRVTNEPKAKADSPVTTFLYHEKSYQEWIRILHTERRVSMLGEAIQAVIALADESQQLEAAKACLLPARRYGNSSSIGAMDGKEQMLLDDEEYFMTYYDHKFDAFESAHVFQALVEEMEANHPRSDLACRTILSLSSNFRQLLSPKANPKLKDLLVRFKDQFLQPIPQVANLSIESLNNWGVDRAMRISEELDESIESDPRYIELAEMILKTPSKFHVMGFEELGKNRRNAIPIMHLHLLAKLGRLNELPLTYVVDSIVGDWNSGYDHIIDEIISAIPKSMHTEFSNLVSKKLKDDYIIPNSRSLADLMVANAKDPPGLATLLREKSQGISVGNGFRFGSAEIAEFYIELADRLDPANKPKESTPTATVEEKEEAKFNRIGFSEWLTTLQDERNSKLVSDAVEAVVTLAKTDDESLAAAKACLVAARSFGGYATIAEFTNPINPDKASIDFMETLDRMYPKLAPLLAVQAIELELQSKNRRSIRTCKFLLDRLDQLVSDPNVLESKLGQDSLKNIENFLKSSEDTSGPPDWNQKYRFKLAYWKNQSIKDEPDLIAFLESAILKLETDIRGFSPSMLYATWEIKRLENVRPDIGASLLTGSIRDDGSVEKLRDPDTIKLLAWYKTSLHAEAIYDELLRIFTNTSFEYSSIIENYLVENAANPKSVREAIQKSIDALIQQDNGPFGLDQASQDRTKIHLEKLKRTLDRLSQED